MFFLAVLIDFICLAFGQNLAYIIRFDFGPENDRGLCRYLYSLNIVSPALATTCGYRLTSVINAVAILI